MNVSSNTASTTTVIKSKSEKSKEYQENQKNMRIRKAPAKQSATMSRVALGVVGIIGGAVTAGLGVHLLHNGSETLNQIASARERCLEQLTPFECSGLTGTIVVSLASQDAAIGYMLAGAGLIVGVCSSFFTASSSINMCKEAQKDVGTKKSN